MSYFRLPRKLWSYYDQEGKLPDIIEKAYSTWYSNCPAHDIHIVNRSEIGSLVPEKYLPENLHELNHVDKAEAIGVALVRKYGGIFICSGLMTNENLRWVHDEIDKTERNFVGVLDKEKNKVKGYLFAAPAESPMITRINKRIVSKGMGMAAALDDLIESKNSEIEDQFKKEKVLLVDSSNFEALIRDPQANASDHNTLLVPEFHQLVDKPGTVFRHFMDRNKVPVFSRFRPAVDLSREPTQKEKIPAAVVMASLIIGMFVLLYNA